MLLVVGILLMVLLWPFVAISALGYYTGPYEAPDKATVGSTYKFTGTIYGATNKGGYSAIVVDFDDNESIPWIAEGNFNKGDRVLLVFTVTKEQNESLSGEHQKMTMTDEEKDSILSSAKLMDEETMKSTYEQMQSSLDEQGIKASVNKMPDTGGMVGIALLILGLILAILGAALGRRPKIQEPVPSQPPVQGYQQPQQQYQDQPQYPQPPPQQQEYPESPTPPEQSEEPPVF